MGLLHWLFGKHEVRQPREDHVVLLTRLPLWRAQLVLHHLWESGIPVTMSEASVPIARATEWGPMANLYVMEARLQAAQAEVEALDRLHRSSASDDASPTTSPVEDEYHDD